MKIALTIAGSDSSGGAGIQADLKTFHAHGIYGVCAITAITVQNTLKVYDIQEVDPKIVQNQIRCLFNDLTIHAVKIGMVASIQLIEAVAEALLEVNLPPLVLDPVMISKSGYHLLSPDAQTALVKCLFPLTDVLTPNILEAESLTGKHIASPEDMKIAAKDIMDMGVKKAVVKGGHLNSESAIDVAFDGSTYQLYEDKRIDTKNTHGTGCTFSSAIAANIAKDKTFFEAVGLSKNYISQAINRAPGIGHGHGPVHHFFNWH